MADFTKLQCSLDALLDEAIGERRIVGAVVLVSVAGHRIYEQAAGYADREARAPCRLDTIFRWASLTKAVVAAVTLALCERQIISLDDPVTRFLPTFRPSLPNGETPIITVRHLITHTAGLTYRMFEPSDGPYHRANVSDGMDQPGLSIEENLERIASAALVRAPGSGWGYSVAADVLGEFIARATRSSLPELVKTLVTAPLGMTDSAFVVADRARLATPYGNEKPTPARMGSNHLTVFTDGAVAFAPDRMFDPNSYPSGGTGMSGTAGDFLRLLETLRTGGGTVLTTASVELLSTIKPGDFETILPGSKWPLGWAVIDDPAKGKTPQSRGTWLWGGVYGCSWSIDPAKQLSVAVLTNTAITGMLGPFPDALRDAIYASLGADLGV